MDLVVDYTGSGQYYHDDLDTTVFNDPVKGYELIRDVDKKRNDLVWLSPAKANNTESLAVLRSFGEANGLENHEGPGRLGERGQAGQADLRRRVRGKPPGSARASRRPTASSSARTS
ncbi:MAG: hypothetical protein MZV65_16130 [Chromatiales bacterium]|nr:hypothetical protein [Chromatiales bacterium]